MSEAVAMNPSARQAWQEFTARKSCSQSKCFANNLHQPKAVSTQASYQNRRIQEDSLQ